MLEGWRWKECLLQAIPQLALLGLNSKLDIEAATFRHVLLS